VRYLAMETAEIKKTVLEIRKKAINVACALKGFKEEDCYETVFEEDEIEVVFSWNSGCSCCSDEEQRVYVKYEELTQDIEALKKEKEQQRIEEKRKKDEAEKLRKQKEADAKKKREEAEYLRLKKKFESA
jgi:NADH:ubiquinone oxidoreductase subunit D|tara:strand:- start:64962 stop:65351 length:390 start_codon:yes stop_codon:yes gene_type:complete